MVTLLKQMGKILLGSVLEIKIWLNVKRKWNVAPKNDDPFYLDLHKMQIFKIILSKYTKIR